ncbi:MAG: hypothetical protein WC502_06040 [Methanolinea sp.]|jgi:hypothetical protein|nr:hypothetical protein [Methanolinea sp.]
MTGTSMRIQTISGLLILCTALIAAGCMESPDLSQATVVTTAPTVLPTASPTLSLVPEPTDMVPSTYHVEVQVVKNTISTDPSITVTYEGGQGLAFTTSMTAQVIRSDRQVEQQTLDHPKMESEIVLSGTTHTDRVLVFVTMANGVTYKVFDKDMPFQPINPQH